MSLTLRSVICYTGKDTWQENSASMFMALDEFIDSVNKLLYIYRLIGVSWRQLCCLQLGLPPVVHLSALGFGLDLTGSWWWCQATDRYEYRNQKSCCLNGK
jgi:hypothetical protein